MHTRDKKLKHCMHFVCLLMGTYESGQDKIMPLHVYFAKLHPWHTFFLLLFFFFVVDHTGDVNAQMCIIPKGCTQPHMCPKTSGKTHATNKGFNN